ncbi:MAG: rhomboid family intramembrane serine protease [Planctomycetaceae bacterium]
MASFSEFEANPLTADTHTTASERISTSRVKLLMGLDNRDYLRDESVYDDGYGQPEPRTQMSMVVRIVVATVVVFVLQVFLTRNGESLVTNWLALTPDDLFRGQIWRLLTYAFCHSRQDVLHILFNMYILWMLGREVSRLTGEKEFLFFYLASAIFAGIVSVCFYQLMGLPATIIGASGAVMAVFLLFAMHYPRQKLFLFGVLGIEVRWLLAAFVAFDALPVVVTILQGSEAAIRNAAEQARNGKAMTANSAHLGGLLFGYLYFRWNMRLTRWWDNVSGRAAGMKRPKSSLKVYNPVTQPEPDLSDRVDEILDKISREGEASLTSRERRILTQASEQLKKSKR